MFFILFFVFIYFLRSFEQLSNPRGKQNVQNHVDDRQTHYGGHIQGQGMSECPDRHRGDTKPKPYIENV